MEEHITKQRLGQWSYTRCPNSWLWYPSSFL